MVMSLTSIVRNPAGRKSVIRLACFDLGMIGACVEVNLGSKHADLTRHVTYKRHHTWDLGKGTKKAPGLNVKDPDCYFWFMERIGGIIAGADVIVYELVQFNRGRSSIPGFRGILHAVCGIYQRPCIGVNVATLKSFAGLKKVPKGQSKGHMAIAMAENYPDFWETLSGRGRTNDNVVDAAMLCHWAAAHLEIE